MQNPLIKYNQDDLKRLLECTLTWHLVLDHFYFLSDSFIGTMVMQRMTESTFQFWNILRVRFVYYLYFQFECTQCSQNQTGFFSSLEVLLQNVVTF